MWFPNHFRLGRRGPSAEWIDYVASADVLQYESGASLVQTDKNEASKVAVDEIRYASADFSRVPSPSPDAARQPDGAPPHLEVLR